MKDNIYFYRLENQLFITQIKNDMNYSTPVRISQIIPMALYGHSLMKEVIGFNLDVYIAHIGSLRSRIKSIKIYTRSGSRNHFVHDERTNRMFEFISCHTINTAEQYDELIRAYLMEAR